MKASFTLFGIPFDMARRSRRRWLVMTVYVVIAASIAGAGLVNLRWPRFFSLVLAFLIPIFFTGFLNTNVLGGLQCWGGGLIKPFFGNETLSSYGMEGQDVPRFFKDRYLNDEWDLRRRNEAHWRAYRWMYPMIGLPWWVACMRRYAPLLPNWVTSLPFDILLCCLLTALICLYTTLPQAILLWTEPDMEASK